MLLISRIKVVGGIWAPFVGYGVIAVPFASDALLVVYIRELIQNKLCILVSLPLVINLLDSGRQLPFYQLS